MEQPRLLRRLRNHMSSVVVAANAQYYVSIVDWDTMVCFLTIQETKLLHRKMAMPVIEHLSIMKSYRLASHYA